MTAACLLLMSSVVGQYYAPQYGNGYGNGYGYPYYGRTPLQTMDPMRYNRYYNGEGYYNYTPPVIANPEVINFNRPVTTQSATSGQVHSVSGTTGQVLSVDEPKKQIKLQLPAGVITVAYGPTTHFLATDGNFPVIKPGNLINVNQDTITILRRSSK